MKLSATPEVCTGGTPPPCITAPEPTTTTTVVVLPITRRVCGPGVGGPCDNSAATTTTEVTTTTTTLAPSGLRLPATGSTSAPMVGGAGVSLLLGVVLSVASLRRRVAR